MGRGHRGRRPARAALSFLLLTFGSAVGLSLSSPWPNAGASGLTLVILATLFAILVQVGSFAIGGTSPGACARAGMTRSKPDRSSAMARMAFSSGAWASSSVRSSPPARSGLSPRPARKSVQRWPAVRRSAPAPLLAVPREATNPMDYTVDLLFRPNAAEPATAQSATTPGGAVQVGRCRRARRNPIPAIAARRRAS